MEALNNFSLACLMFGLFCGVVAWIASERERRQIERVAELMRRVTL